MAEVRDMTGVDDIVCPWNGFKPCFKERCPMWYHEVWKNPFTKEYEERCGCIRNYMGARG